MKIANQQKLIIGVAGLAVFVLLVTTVWSRPGFLYRPTSPEKQAELQKSQADSLKEYRDYLASVHTDPIASSLIFAKVFDTKAIAQDIREQIGADKPAVIPKVNLTDLKVNNTADPAVIKDYVSKLQDRLAQYHGEVLPTLDNVLTDFPDVVLASNADNSAKSLLTDLYSQSVPKPAIPLHSAIISAYTTSEQMFADAKHAASLDAPTGQWKHSNLAYVTTRTQVDSMNDIVKQLEQAYAFNAGDTSEGGESNVFIPIAKAVPVSVIYSIPQTVSNFLRSALGVAIINATRQMLTKYITNTEKNYLVSNYLYYTNALVNSKYANDYLNKNIPDAKDREQIKKFLPEFSCGIQNEAELQKQMSAKAIEFLGFDPKYLDPADPDFYKKVVKTVDPKADTTGDGYRKFYESLATVASASANGAAFTEEIGPTKKVAQTADLKNIKVSLDNISGQQRAASNALFNIPVANATTGSFGFDKFMTNQVLGILKQFLIKEAVVIKEQQTCVKVPVVNPIIPGDFTPNKIQPTEAEVQACTDDPTGEECARIYFQTPYDSGGNSLLTDCPVLQNVSNNGRILSDGLYLNVSPARTKVGVDIQLDYGLQPACAQKIAENLKAGSTLQLGVYGGDFYPTSCVLPTDPEDPTKQIVVVQPFSTQLEGSVVLDSRLIATRLDRNGVEVVKPGRQVVTALITGVDDDGHPLCISGTVELQLDAPNIRSELPASSPFALRPLGKFALAWR